MKDFTKENNPRWKGGVKIHAYGYRLIASPDHPNRDKQGYVREHRLVMEKHLGRYLNKEELIHHINHNKVDNRLENLMIISRSAHKKLHTEIGQETRFKKGRIGNKTGEYKECVLCFNKFYVIKSARPTKRFCSLACKYKDMKGKKIGSDYYKQFKIQYGFY